MKHFNNEMEEQEDEYFQLHTCEGGETCIGCCGASVALFSVSNVCLDITIVVVF